MGTWTSTTYERHDGSLHLSCAETAKLVRKALKRAFPTTKFSVRSNSYSGGAAIHVNWTDGPTGSQVDRVVDPYRGADYDGMIDLKTHNEHWLEPDGTAYVARVEGTTGSIVGYVQDPRSANAKLVSFGADFIQCQRSLSNETEAKIKQEIAAFTGEPFPENSGAILPVSVHEIRDAGRPGTLLSRDDSGINTTWPDNLVWRIGAGRDYSTPCDHSADLRYGCGGGKVRCGGCGA